MNHLNTYSACIMKIKYLLLILGFGLVSSQMSGQTLAIVNNNSNDAYIDVSWSLPVTCFEESPGVAYPEGVYLQLLADGVEVYKEIIETKEPETAENVFRHFVGPSKNITYTLNLYEQGPGDLIGGGCSGLTTMGQTTAFAPPTAFVASQDTLVDRIELSWTNNSKLSTNYYVVRKANGRERIIEVLPGTDSVGLELNYTDQFSFVDTTSIVNGNAYTYPRPLYIGGCHLIYLQ